MLRDGLTWREYQQRVGGVAGTVAPTPVKPPTRKIPDSQPPSREWQAAALDAAIDCAATLTETPAILRYLHASRGISEQAAFTAGLGFNPAWRDVAGSRLAPGITIPCYADDEGDGLWYVNVRVTKAAQTDKVGKYHALAGSRLSSLYENASLHGAHSGIVCEGELDAVLLSQLVPAGVGVVTMGSAGSLPDARWLWRFAGVDSIWVVMDGDAAGQAGLTRWQGWLKQAKAAPALAGDITDLWQLGGDAAVREWLGTFLSLKEQGVCDETSI